MPRRTFALVAALVIALAVCAASAEAGGGAATVAKKKCKKHKKKKCKRPVAAPVAPAPVPGPLQRAQLTWTDPGDIDLNLWVFDVNGNRGRAASNGVPSSVFSTDDQGSTGFETFTDLIYVQPGARQFSFGVCYQSAAVVPATFQLTYVTSDGVSHAGNGVLTAQGQTATFPGGAPIPATATWCSAV